MPVCFTDLQKMTKNLRSSFRKVSFKGVEKTSAFPVTNSFAVKAQYNALSENAETSTYDTVIIFHHLNFGEKKSKDLPIKINPTNNAVLWMERPSLSDSNITCTVMCTCDDYFWTWWFNNSKKARAHALTNLPHPSEITGHDRRVSDGKSYGSPPGQYIFHKVRDGKGRVTIVKRKAPAGWDPRRNPVNTPGICKHLNHSGEYLKKKKVVLG